MTRKNVPGKTPGNVVVVKGVGVEGPGASEHRVEMDGCEMESSGRVTGLSCHVYPEEK